jgi:hypothetical protein
MYENSAKTAGFALIALQIAENAVFLLKSTSQNILPTCFLRNTLILKFFVSQGVVELHIPVQSSGSHVHPQPPG